MGSSDRDYYREEARRMAGPKVPAVTKWLVISNLLIFFADMFGGLDLKGFGEFSMASAFLEGHLWELVTFQFLHANLGHVAFNCIGIWVFAPYVERWWGRGRFLIFYLLCGAAGALFFSLLSTIHVIQDSSIYTPLVGASAGIYGLMIAVYVLDPEQRVQLIFPPVNLSMRQLAMICTGMGVAVILVNLVARTTIFSNSGGEAGHLGGALLGFLLMKKPHLLRKGGSRSARSKIIRPAEFKKKRGAPKLHPRSELLNDDSSEVDRILDKINLDGLDSLSDQDREVLKRAKDSQDSKS